MDIRSALREARDQAGLSQAEMARRAGTTQPAVAAYEGGRAVPSWRALDRLLEVCGFSARLRLQPRHFDIDRELDAMLAQPPGERLLARSSLVLTIASLDSPVVVVGAAALVAHGVPVQVQALDLAVGTTPAEVDGAVRLLQKVFARYTPTDFEDPLPGWVVPETVTLPGRRRLRTPLEQVELWPGHLSAVRDRAVGVPLGEGTVWVAALPDVEPPAEDADLVRRYLDRLAVRSRQSERVVPPLFDGDEPQLGIDGSHVGVARGVPGLDLGDLWSLSE